MPGSCRCAGRKIERTNEPAKPRGPFCKAADVALLAELRPIKQRPTYRYRRLRALLNRQRRVEGTLMVNAKRVLRVMQQNGITHQEHTALRPTRAHEGGVIAPRSNIRWCSDHLEIHARNGEVVRMVFVIEACDREIIAWSAVSNAGISGEMVCDLMIAAVERRCKSLKVPHPLEWLSDNGSAYIARQTAQVAAALGIILRFTPVRSPQSNGMSEAFVKILKRDYASTAILPDADTIQALLPKWIDDYCDVHLHSGLKFRSPRQFLRLSA